MNCDSVDQFRFMTLLHLSKNHSITEEFWVEVRRGLLTFPESILKPAVYCTEIDTWGGDVSDNVPLEIRGCGYE